MVLEHSPNGATGVVINSPENLAIRERLHVNAENIHGPADIAEALEKLREDFPPIQDPNATEGQSFEIPVTFCVAQGPKNSPEGSELSHSVRVFVGRVKWPQGGIEREIEQGVWLKCFAAPEFIFGDHVDLWGAVVRHVGERTFKGMLGTERDQDFANN